MSSISIPFAESEILGRCLDCDWIVKGEASIMLQGGPQTLVSIVIVTKDGASHTLARTEARAPQHVPSHVQPGGHT